MREANHAEVQKMKIKDLFKGPSLRVTTAEGTYYVIPVASGDDRWHRHV